MWHCLRVPGKFPQPYTASSEFSMNLLHLLEVVSTGVVSAGVVLYPVRVVKKRKNHQISNH